MPGASRKDRPGKPGTGVNADLEGFFRREIPVTRCMGVSVAGFDGRALLLKAPLAKNLNHKRTAFGGSLYTLATLAGWGMVRLILEGSGLEAHIVIQEGSLAYRRPVLGDFLARCDWPDDAARFRQALARKGKARISLRCEVRAENRPAGEGPAAEFTGIFVATRAALSE
jgi:thioesterase domain-containing protein